MKRSIVASLRSVFRTSKHSGIFPFTIHDDGKLTLTKPGLVASISIQIILVIYTTLLFVVRWIMTFKYKTNFMHEILLTIGQLAIQYGQFIHLLWLIYCREELDEIVQNLIKLEDIDDFAISSTICFWYPTVCCFILIGTPIVELATNVIEFVDVVEYFLVVLKWELAFFCIFQFTGLLSICRSCFKSLKYSIQNPLSGFTKWEILEKSEELINCCEKINTCYGPMLLIMLVSFFGLITTNLYAAYLSWRNASASIICILSAAVLFNTFRYLIKSCTITADIANQFHRDIYKLLLNDVLMSCKDIKLPEENCSNTTISINEAIKEIKENKWDQELDTPLKKIIWQSSLAIEAINQKDVEFTAWGFFPINYTLMCSMVETSATYLMICVQFDDVNDNGKDKHDEKINNDEDTDFENYLNETSTNSTTLTE